jgi:GNAT superfamily N-acetyltransferase
LRIVDYDELPPSLETQAHLLDASAEWMPMDFRRVKEARMMGYPVAPYFGVYAIENGRVLSTVRVLRLPYTPANGRTETVAGIQGVVTRREWSRRGLARMLFAEVHRREIEAGIRFSMLWTGHSGNAHNLYNSIGYLDVYTPYLAIGRCRNPTVRPTGYVMRTARKGDAKTIERLHNDATAGRVGFTQRPRGSIAALFHFWVKPDSFRLIFREGKAVGYLRFQKGEGWVRSDEVVLSGDVPSGDVLKMLEAEVPRGWLILVGTFVRDARPLLRSKGFAFTDYSYYGLLSKPLTGTHPDLSKELGTTSRSFTCHFLDFF